MTRTVNRPHLMNFRATPEEVKRIKELAAAAGYNTSEYIRLVSMGLQFPQVTQ